MNIEALSGILGTVCSIATIFLPEKWKSKKITFALFVFVCVFLCGIIVNQSSKLSRIKKINIAANKLVETHRMDFTDEGFIQAGLAFLEQHKDIHPDAYERAKKIGDRAEKNSNNVSMSYEMLGIIRGIAILNSEN